MLTRVVRAAIILLAGTTILAAQTAYPSRPFAMDYPTCTINLIVLTGPGGIIGTRAVAQPEPDRRTPREAGIKPQ